MTRHLLVAIALGALALACRAQPAASAADLEHLDRTLAGRDRLLQNCSVAMTWQDAGRDYWNRCELKHLHPGRLRLFLGHENEERSWRRDPDLRHVYVVGDRFTVISIPERLYGEKTLTDEVRTPGVLYMCPWFVACGWWPVGCFGRRAGLFMGRPVSVRSALATGTYSLDIGDARLWKLRSADGGDTIVLDAERGFQLRERVVAAANGGVVRFRVIESVRLAGEYWRPARFALEHEGGVATDGCTGAVESFSLGDVVDGDFARSEISRPGTSRIDDDGSIGRQVVAGGHDMLDLLAASVRQWHRPADSPWARIVGSVLLGALIVSAGLLAASRTGARTAAASRLGSASSGPARRRHRPRRRGRAGAPSARAP